MKKEELDMIADLYKIVVSHKINQDKAYSNIEALCDCVDAAAYFFSAVDNNTVRAVFEDSKNSYLKETEPMHLRGQKDTLEFARQQIKQ